VRSRSSSLTFVRSARTSARIVRVSLFISHRKLATLHNFQAYCIAAEASVCWSTEAAERVAHTPQFACATNLSDATNSGGGS
jgi:hypothetical protein